VVHEEIVKCALLFKPVGSGHLRSQGLHLNKVESPCPKDVPCQISTSGQVS